MPFTIEEVERRAYIEGRVDEARYLGCAIEYVSEEVEQLQHEIDMLHSRIGELELCISDHGYDQD